MSECRHEYEQDLASVGRCRCCREFEEQHLQQRIALLEKVAEEAQKALPFIKIHNPTIRNGLKKALRAAGYLED